MHGVLVVIVLLYSAVVDANTPDSIVGPDNDRIALVHAFPGTPRPGGGVLANQNSCLLNNKRKMQNRKGKIRQNLPHHYSHSIAGFDQSQLGLIADQ